MTSIRLLNFALLVDVRYYRILLNITPFNLQAATHLQSRPLFHNTSLLLTIISLCFLLQSYLHPSLPLILLVAGLTHHLRDSIRRGLWLYPFGSTPPVPFPLYISLLLLLGWTVRFLTFSGRGSFKLSSPRKDYVLGDV